MDYVIGCDIGSQGVKTILLSAEGKIAGVAGVGYSIGYPQPTWAEQSAGLWTSAMFQSIDKLIADSGVSPHNIRAIGLDAQVDGFVPIDKFGQPLEPAIIWMDRRAVSQCELISEKISQEKIFQITGLNLDPSHVAPKISWFADNKPESYDKSAYYLLPASYIAYYLTGEIGVDYANASSTLLMDVNTRQWSTELCNLFDIPVHRLAPIHPATQVLGHLRRKIAEKLNLNPETKVILGTGDEHAACLGAGVVGAGLACDIAGTAEPVCAASTHPAFDETRLVETHCHAHPDLWLLENPGFVSGANYRWFRDQFSPLEVSKAHEDNSDVYDLLNEAAGTVPPGSDGLIMLPCLMGAMTPTWNALARGTFMGFTLAHRREHFIRAILEASAYAVRDLIDRMQSLQLNLHEVRVVGGGARSRFWCQIKADVTGLPVSIPETIETTALGAALLALSGAGLTDSLGAAVNLSVRIADTIEPNPARQAIYDDYYHLYRSIYFSLLPVFEQASKITR